MKIIDEWSFLSKIYRMNKFSNDDRKIFMFLNIFYKDYSNELLFLLQSARFKKINFFEEEETIANFNNIFIIKAKFLASKVKSDKISKVTINTDNKIREFYRNAGEITEIISSDIRFIFLWRYNPVIKMKIKMFGKWELNYDSYDEFKKKNSSFEIENEDHWITLLSLFPLKNIKGEKEILGEIKGFGQKKFLKIMELKDFSLFEICKILSIKSVEDLEKRRSIVKNEKIIEEIA